MWIRMGRAVLVAAVVAALVGPAGLRESGATAGDPLGGWPDPPALVPGTATVGGGVWTFTDYPYDDVGAGGYAYPAACACGANAADPVVVQVRRTAAGVEHVVHLNTLLVPDTTMVAFAIDTDDDPITGGGPWPLNAKVASAGWDLVVATWGSGAVAVAHGGSRMPVPAAVDVDANLLAVTVPPAVADPGQGRWRYAGGAGVHDGAGAFAEVVAEGSAVQPAPEGSPTGKTDPDGPNLFNLLFRSRVHDGGSEATDENDSGGFQTARQEAALGAGGGGETADVSAFARIVDFAELAAAGTRIPVEPPGDVHITRVYASAAFPNLLAEGVTGSGATGNLYNGRFQPYRLFVPAEYRADPRPAPMIPMLHGWTGNHRGFNPGGGAFWTDVVRPHRALVPKPLGRGQEIWYEHVGELDVLEVIDDVAAHYNADADRIYLGGTSMGGFGTIKIAEAHPDRFAGILPSVPPMSDRATGYAHPAGNEYDLVEHADSLRNTPVRNFTGTYDVLVPMGNDSRRFCDRLKELVYDHDCWRDVHPSSGGHRGFEHDRAAEVAALLATHTRVRNPARVTYELNPTWVDHNATAGITHLLPYDRVWWVSGIGYAPEPLEVQGRYLDCRATPDSHTCFGELDVRTWGRGDGDPVAAAYFEQPSPTLLRDGIVLSPGAGVEPRNAFDLTVANLTALTLDLERMALRANPPNPLTATVANTGRSVTLELTLVGDVAGTCVAVLDGAVASGQARGGVLTASLPLTAGGQHQLTVACR